jgi:hypothetical protein
MFCPHVTQTPRLSRHHTNIGVSMMQDIELREVSGERDETLSALLELMRAELYFQHPVDLTSRVSLKPLPYISPVLTGHRQSDTTAGCRHINYTGYLRRCMKSWLTPLT